MRPLVRLPLPSARSVLTLHHHFRFNAKRATLVQSRIKALERMAEVQVRCLRWRGAPPRSTSPWCLPVHEHCCRVPRRSVAQVMERDPEYVFDFPFPDTSLPSSVVSFNDVSFGYPGGRELFHNLSFGIDLNTRAAIVGPNGATGGRGHARAALLGAGS